MLLVMQLRKTTSTVEMEEMIGKKSALILLSLEEGELVASLRKVVTLVAVGGDQCIIY